MLNMEVKRDDFRGDINGLRAWAVVSVVLYHFGVFGFSGGFIGVDVFFVISGYLMTGIIAKGLLGSLSSGGRFSILNFYMSRAKRILPALIVLCGFVLILGWAILLPKEYRSLGEYVLSALAFFSNIKFRHESGYFDADSHENLLLHTWSLSVEWQFYLLLPLIMMGVWKLRPKVSTLKAIIVFGVLLSLFWSITITPHKPTAAFYLLKTRAWEMFAGGIVYLWASNVSMSASVRKALEAFGFALIIVSILIFDQSSQWPGWRALVPVLGAALVIVAAKQDSWWTASKLTQWLGTCSYSLYLWHWPIVVVLVFLNLKGDTFAVLAGLALTLLFGWLSYRYIETPVRVGLSKKPMLPSLGFLLVGVLTVSAVATLVKMNEGFPGRVSSLTNAIFNEALNKNPRLVECASAAYGMGPKDNPVPNCTYGNEGVVGAVIIGDSHSSSLVASLKAALGNVDVLQWAANACPLASGVGSDNEKLRCNDFLAWVIKEAKQLPSDVPVVLANRFSLYVYGPNEVDQPLANVVSQYSIGGTDFKGKDYPEKIRAGLIKTVCELSKDRQVYLVRPIPELVLNVPASMGRTMIFDVFTRVSVTREQYNKRNSFVLETLDLAAEQCGAKILDPVPYLCDKASCWGDINGLPVYIDDDHLNERGGEALIPMFKKITAGELIE
ncbi:acyltransferase [Pseudomonas sp. IB20]|uniref:acyltransferase family protein n=1 Tax=Pseudomonas TaxID=286 RepID=UPI000BA11986|nr:MULTISPECIES: acyltransferase family protein [unclassified Pseudomonas]MCV2226635.1 acyltransferase [Pseudomonas sp. AU10]OZO01944.1 acyltransferase [Pseudomonas sp. IB20]